MLFGKRRTRMAVAVYADVVSSLSGALTKINKKSPHAVDQKMVLATHRNAPTTQVGKCNRMYLRGLNAAFNAQKDAKGGKTTMRSYIWALESAAYDAEQG